MEVINPFHSWNVTPREAVEIQERLRTKVIAHGRVEAPRFVAGADIAFSTRSDAIYAVVVLLEFPNLRVVETVTVQDQVSFPYVPGLLSFRETPALLRAFSRLRRAADVIFIDGHGRSHPRAAGIACHIGVLLDRPVIGCAKSLLYGTYREPKPMRSSIEEIRGRDGQMIGAAVRTRDGVSPVFVSIGHKIGLEQAVELTLACGKGYRIPEPTRQADLLAERAKRKGERDAVEEPVERCRTAIESSR
jgi:deoxyribonuclease V